MLQVCRSLCRPASSFKHLLLPPRVRPSHTPLLSISCSSPSSSNCTNTWSTSLSWTTREAHTGTAGKSHGRRKKSIKPTALQYTKRGGSALSQDRAGAGLPEDEDDEEEEERDSKGQSKRKSLRALKWGIQLAALSPSQLRKAIRWASLDEEVYDAVMLVKSLGHNVKNGKRRQFNFIGRLLRDADPESMEQVLTSSQDGDLLGLMAKLNTKPELGEEDETDAIDDKREYLPEEEMTARQWLQGLLDGDEAVNSDVFSSTSDLYFDRQELKKLMRMAKETRDLKSAYRSVEATQAHNALFGFLYDLAQRRKNDA